MDPTIRPAAADDQAAIEAIVEAAYSGYVARNGLVPGPMRDDYGALIETGRVHVLSQDSTVVGLLVLVPEGATMLLDNVAVHPRVKGRGFGGLLLRFAERRAREQGCIAIRLYTQQIMTENIALYGRLGYAETHRAVENGLPRVFMRKSLATTDS